MNSYDEYKTTGLDWLPRVPKHWEVKMGKHIFKRVVREVRSEDEVVTAFRDGQVTLRKNRRLTGFTESNKEIGYQGIRKGDLVIHAMDAFAGAIGVSDSDGKSTPVYSACISPNGDNPFYFAQLLRFVSKTGYLQALAKGIRERSTDFRYEQFANLHFIVPPLDEQRKIVSYLGAKNREIESYIAAKRALLLRLKELSAAVISRAVTRGLNPNVQTKPSGVEWLGDVPQHWEVAALKHRFSVQLGKMLDGDKIKGHSLAPYLRNTDVQWAKINISELPVMDFSDTDRERFSLRPNDLLVCEGGEVGRAAIWTKELENEIGTCFYQKALHRLRPKKSDSPQWMFYLLFAACQNAVFTQGVEKSTIFHLPADDFRQYKFTFPPLEEQRAIVGFIEAQLGTIREAQTRIEREIELARELWTTLVAEVVTGQIDVSAWQGASTPDFSSSVFPDEDDDEPEVLDEEAAFPEE